MQKAEPRTPQACLCRLGPHDGQKLADSLATGGAVHTTVTKKAASITSNWPRSSTPRRRLPEKKTHACQLASSWWSVTD